VNVLLSGSWPSLSDKVSGWFEAGADLLLDLVLATLDPLVEGTFVDAPGRPLEPVSVLYRCLDRLIMFW
jgi:hypothetical protein